MIAGKQTNAKRVSLIAISAALYVAFFFLSYSIALPSFTILYLPIILLGVFPIWFGLSGLAGSLIGAFIGGFFVEGLGFLGWVESVTAFIIYSLNWLLIPKKATEVRKKQNVVLLLSIYAVTLFIGTGYVLWQLAALNVLPIGTAEIVLLPTYGLNLAIEAIACPVLIRTLQPKLKSWGLYSGTFLEWRSLKTKA